MNNTEQNFYQKHLESAQAALDRLDPRLSTLESKKEELLSILNSIEDVRKTILKIKNEQVITQREYDQLDEFNKTNGISAKISYVWEDPAKTDPNEYEYSLKDIESLNLLLYGYPYVVDADEVCDIHSTGLGGFIEIQKNGKVGIIRKGVDDVIYALAPDQYEGILSTDYKDFEKYGVLEIKNPISEGPSINIKSTDTVFLKVHMIGDSISGSLIELGNFNLVTKFDKDNIALAIADDQSYCFVYKNFLSPRNLEIHQLGPSFASNNDTAKKGFDEYNSFAAEGKMIYKKRYDKFGNFDGISVFKKSIIGKEVFVGNYYRASE